MIVLDKPYTLGYESLVWMMLGKLRYPAMIGLGVIVLRIALGFFDRTNSVVSSLLGKPYHAMIFFVCMLALFLMLSVIPEYAGFSYMLDEKGIYIRSGIMSHQVVAIVYRELTSVEIVPSETIFFAKDFVISWHRHGKDETTLLPCLSSTRQKELFAYLTR